MLGKLLQPEIQALVEERDFNTLREVFSELPAVDMADLMNDLPANDQAVIFRLLPKQLATETFEYLDVDTQKALLEAMAEEQVASILNEMSPDDRTALLEELPSTVSRQLIQMLTVEKRTIAQFLLGYPEYSIGRLMTPNYVAVKQEWTVEEVLNYVRTHGQKSETLSMIYVINDRGKLIDDIRIRDLLLAPLDVQIADLMDENFVALTATDDQEAAVKAFRKYDRVALPVTDTEGGLIGIVTVDDVLDVAEEEATEDIQKLGGTEALDEPYLKIALTRMVRKRASWLVVLFLSEMLTATAMSYFEHELEKTVILTLFLPLITSSGGNSGSQASTLIIRALALGEVSLRDWWRVMRREIISGLLLGLILGTIGFLRIAAWSAFTTIYGPHWPLVGLTISFSLIGVVLWGSLVGSMLPFVLKRLGADPATSSAPFVATLVDVTGIVIYLTVAILVLQGTLL